MSQRSRYSTEVRGRAIRLVFEHHGRCPGYGRLRASAWRIVFTTNFQA